MRLSLINGRPASEVLFAYRTVDDAPAAQSILAKRAASLAYDRLDLPRVKVAWFAALDAKAATDAWHAEDRSVFWRRDKMFGETDDRLPDEIHLDVSLEPDQLVKLVGHELQHCQHALSGRVHRLTETEQERECYATGERLLEVVKTSDRRTATHRYEFIGMRRTRDDFVSPKAVAVLREAARIFEAKQQDRDVHYSMIAGYVRACSGGLCRWGITRTQATANLKRALT